MLFHSSIRRELARSFGATLVVLFTIVLTMLLIRTLGLASRGSVNPEEVMLVLGYTVLGRMPVILTLALFIAIVSTLSRLYRDSEVVIWLASGQSLLGFLRPIAQFAWPLLLLITALVWLVWPWANHQTEVLRDRFERRGDLQRVAPGQFQESSGGRRVFFIDRDTAEGTEGRNIFIISQEADGRESVTSARGGRLETLDDQLYLLLERGRRLETQSGSDTTRLSEFEVYAARVTEAPPVIGTSQGLKARSSLELLRQPTPPHQGELGWRVGMALAAFNFVLIALATTVSNPRAGRGGNLLFTLLAFVLYYNLLNAGQRWVATGTVGLLPFMLGLHGGVFGLSLLWLLKRHHNLSLRTAWRRWRGARLEAAP